jgi:hypothetical protein
MVGRLINLKQVENILPAFCRCKGGYDFEKYK